ncbi:hypothetical protein NECAME_10098 [Necator americanus]|uniref:Uncharacterized protein n=1 Tax=Necator americanus TaxID=51031 RepID=W2TAH7_NECAM|nr:hypothetical protein NECAME_10098 [Necator americanus]ETN78838.1 hypothetical protein NECAME_10098 [Necator americanus]
MNYGTYFKLLDFMEITIPFCGAFTAGNDLVGTKISVTSEKFQKQLNPCTKVASSSGDSMDVVKFFGFRNSNDHKVI